MFELARSGNRLSSEESPPSITRQQALQSLQFADSECGSAEVAFTWLGQSAYFFRLNEIGILSDPFLGPRASPSRYVGPKRLGPRPLDVSDLPVNHLLISHNHYDHLCRFTLQRMPSKSEISVVTPIGNGALMRSLGFEKIVELDWYQQVELDGVLYSAFPAYHFSGRSLTDANRSLWASFVVEHEGRRIFFAGDTGYGPEFKRIADLTGKCQLALVPIGAYEPREVFAAVHASPEEAVKIACDVGADCALAMHWGTIKLTIEPFLEPGERFLAAADRANLQALLPAIGETIIRELKVRRPANHS